jgi:hypothetical protein
MPNDAKLGLVAGMAMVVLIAVIFFRKDPAAAQPAPPVFPAPNAVAPEPPPLPKTSPTLPSDNAIPALPPPMLPDP